jgi:uncharacterized membrane protein YdfJ with MMPL/SSD domain
VTIDIIASEGLEPCSRDLGKLTQHRFALALGMLLDTFVVRPLLVPTFLVLVRSGRLGKLIKNPTPTFGHRVPAQ